MNDFLSRSIPRATRRFSRPLTAGFSFTTLIVAALTQFDCAAGYAGGDGDSDGGTGGSGRTGVEIHLGPGGAGGNDLVVHPLCGAGRCDPDTNRGCAPGSSTGGFGGASSGPDLGGGGPGGEGGLLGWGGLSSDGSKGSACRVVESESCSGDDCDVVRQCEPSGKGSELAPCFSSGDCGPGLACVGEGKTGVCRAYCCDGGCSSSAYCAARAQIGQDNEVPVCVPLSNCSLDDPFPCPEGSLCSCAVGKACTLVGKGGQTACLEPGTAKQGEACTGAIAGECSAGFVCAVSLGCLALCRSGEMQSSCGAGFSCQIPPNFPEGFGVCVNTSPSP